MGMTMATPTPRATFHILQTPPLAVVSSTSAYQLIY